MDQISLFIIIGGLALASLSLLIGDREDDK